MTNRPKTIGTKFETDTVKHLKTHGFPAAERIALHGVEDEGDVGACADVMVECKAGAAAENASDAQILTWLDETERERRARAVSIAFLVWKRKGKGAQSAGQWWAAMSGWMFIHLAHLYTAGAHIGMASSVSRAVYDYLPPVRMTLDDAIQLVRRAGYGDKLEGNSND